MEELHFSVYDDKETQTDPEIQIKTEDSTADIGNKAFCIVVSRNGVDRTRIKRFVLPNSFFVVSDSATDSEKTRVQKQIDKIAAPYVVNHYTVERQEFTVPFTVDVIARVSKRYKNTTPKPLAVEDAQINNADSDVGKKGRKRAAEDDEPTGKKSRH
jgi:hypothetical protein